METLTKESVNTLNEFIKNQYGPKSVATQLRDASINMGRLCAELLDNVAVGETPSLPVGMHDNIFHMIELAAMFEKLEVEP